MQPDPVEGSEPLLAVPSGPFRANTGRGICQGKPWAMLFRPLRPRMAYAPRETHTTACVLVDLCLLSRPCAPGLRSDTSAERLQLSDGFS